MSLSSRTLGYKPAVAGAAAGGTSRPVSGQPVANASAAGEDLASGKGPGSDLWITGHRERSPGRPGARGCDRSTRIRDYVTKGARGHGTQASAGCGPDHTPRTGFQNHRVFGNILGEAKVQPRVTFLSEAIRTVTQIVALYPASVPQNSGPAVTMSSGRQGNPAGNAGIPPARLATAGAVAGKTTAAPGMPGTAIKLCLSPGLRGNVVLAGQRQIPIELRGRLPVRRRPPHGPPLFSDTSHHARDPARTAGKAERPRRHNQPPRPSESIPEINNPAALAALSVKRPEGTLPQTPGKEELLQGRREREIRRCGLFRSPDSQTPIQSETDRLLPVKTTCNSTDGSAIHRHRQSAAADPRRDAGPPRMFRESELNEGGGCG